MVFRGYTIDNIAGYRKYFDIEELLRALDGQVVFAHWINEAMESSELEETTASFLASIREAFRSWSLSEENESVQDAKDWKCLVENLDAAWIKKIDAIEPKKAGKERKCFHNMVYLIVLLFKLANRQMEESDTEVVCDFLCQNFAYGEKEGQARIFLHNVKGKDGAWYLQNGTKVIRKHKAEEGRLSFAKDLVQSSVDRHMGSLGVTKEGTVWNASAFVLPKLQKKAVKACISHGHYVILLEDGSIVHNLIEAETPYEAVVDVALSGTHLVWKLADDGIISSEKGSLRQLHSVDEAFL